MARRHAPVLARRVGPARAAARAVFASAVLELCLDFRGHNLVERQAGDGQRLVDDQGPVDLHGGLHHELPGARALQARVPLRPWPEGHCGALADDAQLRVGIRRGGQRQGDGG
jgi:hypothetical protein